MKSFLPVCLGLGLGLASITSAVAADRSIEFDRDVRPILEAKCFSCHGPDKEKGDVRLDTLGTDFVQDRPAAETWHDASNVIQLGEMPPEDEEPLTEEERRIIVEWVEVNLEHALAATSGEASSVVMRRLNRSEYHATLTDLLGFEMDYSGELPSDALSPDGFRNNGAALGLSALQIETSLETARRALDFVLVEGEAPERSVEPVELETKNRRGRGLVGEVSGRLGRVNFWRGAFRDFPRSGRFTIRITARAEKAPDQPDPILALRYGYFVSGLTVNLDAPAGEIEIPSTESRTYEFSSHPDFFPIPEARVPDEKLNGVITLTNALDDGQPTPKPIKKEVEEKRGGKTRKKKVDFYPEDPDFPKVVIESVEFVVNDYPEWPPALHRRIVPEGEDLADADSVRRVLEGFLRRAWRRPATEKELDTWSRHHQQLHEEGASEVEALRETLAAVLASPSFLFLAEPGAGEEGTRPLTDHELAARLSYFLWSSLPDQELDELADSGRLREPEVLAAQFDRLLADPRAERFVEHFTTQWLDLDAVDRVAVNPAIHRGFDNALKKDMVGETIAFFREVLQEDLSALQFLDADFTMLNGALAKHYGLSGPSSQRFERVRLEEGQRPGGFLGHAAVHLAGSDGADSHPIKRAVWIRERLLHDPPKPPPPNVPDLQASVPNFEKLSVREQLAAHREKAACADCHRGIDPWGIALERYSAIGLPRQKSERSGKPVSTETVLPGNHAVSGIEDLQAYLLDQRREQFAHALASKLLTYALGRSLDLSDEPALEELTEAFAEKGYRLAPLMRDIVTSETFTTR